MTLKTLRSDYETPDEDMTAAEDSCLSSHSVRGEMRRQNRPQGSSRWMEEAKRRRREDKAADKWLTEEEKKRKQPRKKNVCERRVIIIIRRMNVT